MISPALYDSSVRADGIIAFRRFLWRCRICGAAAITDYHPGVKAGRIRHMRLIAAFEHYLNGPRCKADELRFENDFRVRTLP